MKHPTFLLRSLALVACCSSRAAATPDEDAAPALCATLAARQYPAKDRPTPAQAQGFGEEDSKRYYYGIGVPVDYVKARHAAFVELARGPGLVFGDEVVLMMLYANGRGVTKDLDLALKVACSNGHAPAEIEYRVRHLERLKRAPEAKPFDVCDDITSGFMQGHCVGLDEERRAVGKQRSLQRLTRVWPKAHRAAFAPLEAAARVFRETRAGNEVDLSGTARAAFVIEEEAALRDAFQAALSRFERGKLPVYSASEASAADAQLNQVYKRAVAQDASDSTVTAEGIRNTERAWIRYRDAWVAFGRVRYPAAKAESWATWLSLERTAQLREFVNEAPP